MNKYDSDNRSGINHEGSFPNEPLRFLTASSIIGDHVRNLRGEHLGKISEMMVDLSSGKIQYVVVELGGFLGIGEKYFAIPFPLLKVDPGTHTFILDQDRATLENAPGFDKDHWPDTNSHHFDHFYYYWDNFMTPDKVAER